MEKIFLGLFLGTLFGAALYLVGASNQNRIIAMLRFENLRLMKIIFGGIGWGSILLGIGLSSGLVDVSHLSIKSTHAGVIIGGLIFGVGFALARSCPGTCLVGLGRGSRLSIATVVGGLAGAFLYSVTHHLWLESGIFEVLALGKMTLFSLSEKFPAVVNVGPLGLTVMGILFMGIAFLIPEKMRA